MSNKHVTSSLLPTFSYFNFSYFPLPVSLEFNVFFPTTIITKDDCKAFQKLFQHSNTSYMCVCVCVPVPDVYQSDYLRQGTDL